MKFLAIFMSIVCLLSFVSLLYTALFDQVFGRLWQDVEKAENALGFLTVVSAILGGIFLIWWLCIQDVKEEKTSCK